VYYLFLLWLPFNIKRGWLMLIAFATGFALDAFRLNFGFHAAACVLMAYARPFVINILISQEGAETNYAEPTIKSMGGFVPYLIYIAILSVIHHVWLFLLQAWQMRDLWYLFLSVLVSLLLIVITELVFSRKQQFKTNTA
jgi:hypothetical protein